jgi:hypothetical protein
MLSSAFNYLEVFQLFVFKYSWSGLLTSLKTALDFPFGAVARHPEWLVRDEQNPTWQVSQIFQTIFSNFVQHCFFIKCCLSTFILDVLIDLGAHKKERFFIFFTLSANSRSFSVKRTAVKIRKVSHFSKPTSSL